MVNTSMTSLDAFAHLTSVTAPINNQPFILPMHLSGNYSVIVTGLTVSFFFNFRQACLFLYFPGNRFLFDLGNILTIQSTAFYGTYIAGNAALCFSPPVLWGRRADSYIEYSTEFVRFYCLLQALLIIYLFTGALVRRIFLKKKRRRKVLLRQKLVCLLSINTGT